MNVGFCVIYRWTILAGKEEQFQAAWATLTEEIRDHAGGLGSRLHRAADGTWLAYAQWPSREAWDAADVATARARQAGAALAATVAERWDPILLDPVQDYLM